MSEILFEKILEYISDIENREKTNFRRLLKWFDGIIYDFNKTAEDWEKYREMFLELREIRDIYQKGKSFVNNQTKGQKKQFTPINTRISTLKFILKKDRKKKAQEIAKSDLKFFKEFYSERTYYRFKKELKKLDLGF